MWTLFRVKIQKTQFSQKRKLLNLKSDFWYCFITHGSYLLKYVRGVPSVILWPKSLWTSLEFATKPNTFQNSGCPIPLACIHWLMAVTTWLTLFCAQAVRICAVPTPLSECNTVTEQVGGRLPNVPESRVQKLTNRFSCNFQDMLNFREARS